MLPEVWIEHRRSDDRELVGWIAPEGDDFVAFDLLGRKVTEHPVDWLTAEEALEARGLGFLAGRHRLQFSDGTSRPVRITEVNTEHIVVIADEFGIASAVGSGADTFELPFPAPAELEIAG
ncbi:MAG: hypothetical protein KF867_08410 [Cryobacterium sp.]|nr:hypothetical protein [Cryobacterium sp.]MBX3104984.1 hypothetical protein [Cryobacterium sp.]